MTFENPDGVSRQDILAKSREDDLLAFVAEPDNPHGDHAVAVYRVRRGWLGGLKLAQLGYLPNERSGERVFDELQDGWTIAGRISEITGGTFDKPTLGCNIEIEIMAEPPD